MKTVPLSRYAAFVAIALAGCLVDLGTKRFMFHRLGMPPSDTWWIWEPYAGFQASMNEGALFGMGQGWVLIFAGLSFVAALGICYWLFIVGAALDWLLTIAFALVMGGILGNLHDRLGLWEVPGMPGVRHHAVRDWVLVQWPPWVWPNFNVADSLLVCGITLLVCHALWHGSPRKGDAVASQFGQRA